MTAAAVANIVLSPAALVDALDTEARLLRDLAALLRAQREAIAAADLQRLEDTVLGAQRVLATLKEARTRRRLIVQGLAGASEVPIGRLEDVLSSDLLSPAVCRARDELCAVADGVMQDVSLNRRIIAGALRAGDAHLHALAGEPYGTLTYGEPSDTPGRGRARLSFFNEQV